MLKQLALVINLIAVSTLICMNQLYVSAALSAADTCSFKEQRKIYSAKDNVAIQRLKENKERYSYMKRQSTQQDDTKYVAM